jgi:hypothetical protein
MLTYDPDRRPSGRDALRRDYWRVGPLPRAADQMPTFPADLASLGNAPSTKGVRKRPISPGKEEAVSGKKASRQHDSRFGRVF